jgi:hypothetical protein
MTKELPVMQRQSRHSGEGPLLSRENEALQKKHDIQLDADNFF